MDVAEQKEQQAGAIAYKILSLAKDSVLSEYPFLERAAARLVPAVNDTYRFAGSGSLLLFDPLYLFTLFRQSQCLVNRAWLHTLLHRLLCHNLVGKSINRPLWNLACDVAVENIMNEWGRCRAAPLASIRQMSRQGSRGSAGEYQADEQEGLDEELKAWFKGQLGK